MSTDTASTPALEEQVTTFLEQNFPQISFHGGDATVLECDEDAGAVDILLAGACSGCGISPMTIQAITSRLPAEIAAIDDVSVETGSVEDTDNESHGMGGHPAGGGVNPEFEGEMPDWRSDD